MSERVCVCCVLVCMYACVLFLSHLSSTASLYSYLPTRPIYPPTLHAFPSLPFYFFLPFLLFLPFPSLLLSFFLPSHSTPSLPFHSSTPFYLFPFIPSFLSFISFHSFVHNVLCFLLDCLLSLVWACMCVGERVRAVRG